MIFQKNIYNRYYKMKLNYLNYNSENEKNNHIGFGNFDNADYLPASFDDLTGLKSSSIKPDVQNIQNISTSNFEIKLDNSMNNKNLDNPQDWMDTSSVYIENSVEPFRGGSRGTSSGVSGSNLYLASKTNQNQSRTDGKISSIFFAVTVFMLILLAGYAYIMENYGSDNSSL